MRNACKLLIVCLLVTSAQAFADEPEDSLVAHWSLDQADFQQGVYQDSTIHSRDADPQTVPTAFVAGAFGTSNCAVDLGVDDESYGRAGTFNPSEGTGQFTISAWVYWNGDDRSGIVSKRNSWGNSDMMWMFEIETYGRLRLRSYNNYIEYGTSP